MKRVLQVFLITETRTDEIEDKGRHFLSESEGARPDLKIAQLHGPEYEGTLPKLTLGACLVGSRRGADGARERSLRSTGGPPMTIKAPGMIGTIIPKQHT